MIRVSFQRRKVLQVMLRNGVTVLREGGNHTVLRGPNGKRSVLGRHAELNRVTIRKMMRQLELDERLVEEMR